jgi:hypothetical protein
VRRLILHVYAVLAVREVVHGAAEVVVAAGCTRALRQRRARMLHVGVTVRAKYRLIGHALHLLEDCSGGGELCGLGGSAVGGECCESGVLCTETGLTYRGGGEIGGHVGWQHAEQFCLEVDEVTGGAEGRGRAAAVQALRSLDFYVKIYMDIDRRSAVALRWLFSFNHAALFHVWLHQLGPVQCDRGCNGAHARRV